MITVDKGPRPETKGRDRSLSLHLLSARGKRPIGNETSHNDFLYVKGSGVGLGTGVGRGNHW